MKGFTLIEAVLAVGVFALLAVTGALLLFSTLRGANKAAAAIEVRSQGANAMGVMTQLLRYAKKNSLLCSGNGVTFTAADGGQGSFSCVGDDYLASRSGRLTSPKVKVVSCTNVFTCPSASQAVINFSLNRANATFIDESSRINFESQIELRNR